MNNAMFMIPHVRGAGFAVDVHHDPAVGSVPSVDELATMSTLIEQWSGLLRALTLCGYRAVEVFVEVEPARATQRLVLDLATFGLGSAPVAADGLDGIRDDAPALLVAVTLDPLWPFGGRAGVPLALELPAGEIQAIPGAFALVDQTERGWLALTSAEDLTTAGPGLAQRGLQLAEVLSGVIIGAWGRGPDPRGQPAGLSWMFDDRNWWFPPDAPDRIRPDARVLHTALRAVAARLWTGDIDIPAFVTEQVVRKHDPRLLAPSGSFANLTRTYSSQSPDAAVSAYRDRVSSLTTAELPALLETAEIIDERFTWTDAVLAMIEHGAVAVAHRLLPGLPESVITTWPMPSAPEWTTPQLTGQWDAEPGVGRKDTLILNQAGTSIAGYWQLHHTMSLERYQLAGTLLRRETDGTLVFTVQCWAQPAPDDVGPFLTTAGEIRIPPVTGTAPQLVLETEVAGDPGIFLFAKTAGPVDGAHHTEATMRGLPDPVKERIRALRDAPLHYEELKGAYYLLVTAATFIQRFLEEQPDLQGLLELMDEFKAAVEAVGQGSPPKRIVSFLPNDELVATAAFYVKSVLANVQALGSDTALSVLLQMFRLTYSYHSSVELQRIYDLKVLPDGIGDFRYQWRLINTSMTGAGLGVSHARGTGTFQLRRVDETGQVISPVVSRTIDLYAHELGTVIGKATGPGDFKEWMNLDPTTRDIVPHLDGATLSLIGASGGWLIVESTGTIDVTLQPNDSLPPLRGYIDAALIEFPIFEPFSDELDPEEVYDRAKQVKDLVDTLKEVGDKVRKGLEESAKKGLKEGVKGFKKVKPDFKLSTLDGWIRTANGQPTAPAEEPVPIDEYTEGGATWARFETNQYELTPQFRDAIREMLLQNLALFTGLGEIVIEGNASQIGSDDYNVRLSRDRAVSVLTAIYDILGPQLAVPFGDIRVRGLGSSQATGDPGSDEAIDRRVDVVIRGRVRMRS